METYLMCFSGILVAIGFAYMYTEILRRDKRIEVLLDRLMSKDLPEFKRSQRQFRPGVARPAPSDEEMARWEERQIQGQADIRQEIDEKLAKVLSMGKGVSNG